MKSAIPQKKSVIDDKLHGARLRLSKTCPTTQNNNYDYFEIIMAIIIYKRADLTILLIQNLFINPVTPIPFVVQDNNYSSRSDR